MNAASTELQNLAARLIWWQPVEVSLQSPVRLVAQVMNLGTWEEVQQASRIFGWDAFREVIDKAQPGWLDRRSWSYWHAFFGLPDRPLPQRSLS